MIKNRFAPFWLAAFTLTFFLQSASVWAESEPWTTVGTAEFENSWESFDSSSYAPVSYYMDHDNVVHLRGIANNASQPAVDEVIFTLPATYSPATNETSRFAIEAIIDDVKTIARIAINEDGDVFLESGFSSGGSDYKVSLFGASFRVPYTSSEPRIVSVEDQVELYKVSAGITPAANYLAVYAKTDGKLYFMDSTAVEHQITYADSAGADEDWHEIGASGEPAFENDWVNFNSSTLETAAFYKDRLGRVHLKGIIKSINGASNAFTLPEGYRPPKNSRYATYGVDANGATYSGRFAAKISIAANGMVWPLSGFADEISLESISFRAAE